MAAKGMESTQQRKGNGTEEFVPMPPSLSEKKEGGGQTGKEEQSGGNVQRANGQSGQNEFLDQAKSTASEAYDKVSERTRSSIEDKKAGMTGGLKSVADSIRVAGNELSKVNETTTITDYSARYAAMAADKLEGVAEYFDERDLRTIGQDVENYARRNPMIFVGAAFGLGLLAARFLKSSAAGQSNSPQAGNNTQKPRAKKNGADANAAQN
jgi:hypothetical protein